MQGKLSHILESDRAVFKKIEAPKKTTPEPSTIKEKLEEIK